MYGYLQSLIAKFAIAQEEGNVIHLMQSLKASIWLLLTTKLSGYILYKNDNLAISKLFQI